MTLTWLFSCYHLAAGWLGQWLEFTELGMGLAQEKCLKINALCGPCASTSQGFSSGVPLQNVGQVGKVPEPKSVCQLLLAKL